MSRGVDQRISDILVAVERCKRYSRYLTVANNNDLVNMAEDAIARNLQIIGEAANKLPDAITQAHPEIPWQQIRGFRNILVHQYFGVELEIVHDVVVTHLPPLATVLKLYHKSQ